MTDDEIRAYAREHGFTLRRVPVRARSRTRDGRRYRWHITGHRASMWACGWTDARYLIDSAYAMEKP
jgi:hypothetical protein